MKTLKYTILVLYLLVAVFLTFCMFNVNSYGDVKIDNIYFIGMREKIKPFANSSLVYGKSNIDKISNGSKILYYNSKEVKSGVISDVKESSVKNKTYVLSSNIYVSSDDVIGLQKDAKSIPLLGSVLSFVTSSTGYLLCVLFPVFIIFLFQIFNFVRVRKNA